MFHPLWLKDICWCVFPVVIGLVCIEPTFAQVWHIGNPPLTQSVPQYIPQYPLNDESESILVDATSAVRPITPGNVQGFAKPVENALPQSHEPANSSRKDEISLNPNPATGASLATEKRSSLGRNFELDRDRSTFPIDPRKPCSPCTQPPQTRLATKLDWPGLGGRPYQDREPGGCQCGQRGCHQCKQFSTNWPAPFSALHERRHPSSAELRDVPCQPSRLTDVFDPLAKFKLVEVQRSDNGHCGSGADPYGCLGESRYGSRVAGIGYRNPSEPAASPVPALR